ncbi:MAG: DNA-3-methyladenine glycosylase I [Desulfuromonadales bacterium]|nr:DNA-3-methyladenine glycosylase I [Desulfuromonadales bacterium]
MPARQRCPWVDLSKPDYVAYHDEEWGVPVVDDRRLFEFLILEGAQAGLSWYTVLRKRAHYREIYLGFDPNKVARFDQDKVTELLADPGIIRNRNKIEASIGNARAFLEVQQEFGRFADYLWRFVGGVPKVNRLRSRDDYPTSSPEAETLSRDLKRRGFRFVGPIICYSYMQAVGLVNDHSIDCFRRAELLT